EVRPVRGGDRRHARQDRRRARAVAPRGRRLQVVRARDRARDLHEGAGRLLRLVHQAARRLEEERASVTGSYPCHPPRIVRTSPDSGGPSAGGVFGSDRKYSTKGRSSLSTGPLPRWRRMPSASARNRRSRSSKLATPISASSARSPGSAALRSKSARERRSGPLPPTSTCSPSNT